MKLEAILPLAFCVCSAHGALVLNDFSPVVENFNGFTDGTEASVPANFVAAHDLGATAFGGRVLTSGSSAYNSTTGWYSLNDNDSPADFAFGARTNGGSGQGTLTFQVTNMTGATIPGISLAFNLEQYTNSLSGNRLDVLASSDGSTFNMTSLTGDTSSMIPSGGGANTVFANPTVTARSVTYGAPVANGDSISFRFSWIVTSGGNRPHYGVDDVSVAAIPEPSAVWLCGLGLLAGVRRRKS